MKQNFFQLLIACLMVGASSIVSGQQDAVSIVFTDERHTLSTDTLIARSAEALAGLLAHHGLNQNDVCMVRLDIPGGMTAGVKQMIFVTDKETDEAAGQDVFIMEGSGFDWTEQNNSASADAGEKTEIRVERVNINGTETGTYFINGREVTKVQADSAMQKAPTEGRNQPCIEKHMEHTGQGVDEKALPGERRLEVRIEKENVNGKETDKYFINGREVTKEEVDAMPQSNGRPVIEKRVFINQHDAHEGSSMSMNEVTLSTPSEGPHKAIVIVKPMYTEDMAKFTAAKSEFTVFPNPAKTTATLRLGAVNGAYNLTLTSLKGEQVHTESGTARGELNHELALSRLSPGTFVITLSHASGLQSTKLVVE